MNVITDGGTFDQDLFISRVSTDFEWTDKLETNTKQGEAMSAYFTTLEGGRVFRNYALGDVQAITDGYEAQ